MGSDNADYWRERYELAQAQLNQIMAKLIDPEVVHANILRGTIKLHPDDALHIGGTSANELEHLRKDKERLDWLGQLLTLEPAAVDCVTLDCKDRGAVRIDRSMSGRGVVAKGHLRAAIDAAMEGEQ